MNATTHHPGALTLRRLQAGETVAPDISAHAGSCPVCQEKLKGFAQEQQAFEKEISFERFAAGVERAARTPRTVQPPRLVQRRLVVVGMALAAMLTAGLVANAVLRDDPHGHNGLKGAGAIEVVVAGIGKQRTVTDEDKVEPLAAGERVRIGLVAEQWRYALVLSIDAHGVVTPIYVDAERSLALAGTPGTQFLPDSLEFTGNGLERVIVLLSAEPLTVRDASTAAKRSFEAAGGNVEKMKSLQLPGAEFDRTFAKP